MILMVLVPNGPAKWPLKKHCLFLSYRVLKRKLSAMPKMEQSLQGAVFIFQTSASFSSLLFNCIIIVASFTSLALSFFLSVCLK